MYKLDGKELSLSDFVKALKEQGKDASQIGAEIALQDADAKVADIMVSVRKELKALEVSEAIKADELKVKEEDAITSKVNEAVKTALKNMPVKAEPQKAIKTFNHFTKKVETSTGATEGEKALANMLEFLSANDVVNAKAVSKEIGQQKEMDYKALGLKTALYSDATTGSYLIPTEVEAEIFEKIYQSVMMQIVNSKTITFNSKLYPVMTNIDLAFIADESTQIGDKTPTISNPTVDMKRIGGMAYASNELLKMRGTELVRAFVNGFGDAAARFIDLYLVGASVTGNADLFDGILFDANTGSITAGALNAITVDDLKNLKNDLGAKFRAGATYIANSKVRDAYGSLEDTAGNPIFKSFVETGNFRPYGKNFIENPYIPSTFDIATEKRTTGNDDVILCVNGEGIYVGFEPLVIAGSEHHLFDYDQFAWRALMKMGVKVISSSSTQGRVATYKKLTN